MVTISPVPEKILSGGVKINVYQLSLNHFSNPSHVSEQGNCGKQPYHAFNQISTFFSYVEVPLRWAALSHGGSLLPQLCPKHRSTSGSTTFTDGGPIAYFSNGFPLQHSTAPPRGYLSSLLVQSCATGCETVAWGSLWWPPCGLPVI